MTDVRVRGTTDPAEIAVVLAILRADRTSETPRGIGLWQACRRAALADRQRPAALGRRR